MLVIVVRHHRIWRHAVQQAALHAHTKYASFAKQSSQTDASHHRCHSHPATSQGLLLCYCDDRYNQGSGEPDKQPTNYSIEKVRTTSHIRTASFAAGSYGPPTLRHLEIAAACRPDFEPWLPTFYSTYAATAVKRLLETRKREILP